MFLLKIMSDQNLPDNDMTKNYKMIAIGSGDQFEFYHDQDTGLPMVQVVPKEGESYSVELTGNAYVVSETGKTVSSHWARSLWGRKTLEITLEEGTTDPEETVRQIQLLVMEQGIKISGSANIKVTVGGTNSDIIAGGRKAFPLATEKTPAPSVHDETDAELARCALLNEASPTVSKITYTA